MFDIIHDALDALNNWFKEMLSNAIIGSLNNTLGTLNSMFSQDNQQTLRPFLSNSPVEFTGVNSDTAGATPVWSGIEVLSNNAIVPIAMFVLTVVLIYELIQYVISGNNFRDFDTSIFFKWTIKSACGILLVSNVFYIATNIFALGSQAVTAGLNTIFPIDSDDVFFTASLDPQIQAHLTSDSFDIGSLLILLILSFLISIVTFIVLGSIIIVLASRIIEIFMYLSISPIPMATMMNNDWGQIGKNWLRNMLALAFQGFFIVVALTIFKVLLGNVTSVLGDMGSSPEDITGSMALMLGFIVALIFTIFRSSNISKSVFSAQ